MKMWNNSSRICTMKFRVLWEGTHGIFFKGFSQWSQCASRNMVLKCKSKPDWTISKFKAQYFVRRDFQKRLSPEPLNSYSPLLQWATVRLMLILQCIIGLQSQIIDFTNACSWADIPSGETVFVPPTASQALIHSRLTSRAFQPLRHFHDYMVRAYHATFISRYMARAYRVPFIIMTQPHDYCASVISTTQHTLE